MTQEGEELLCLLLCIDFPIGGRHALLLLFGHFVFDDVQGVVALGVGAQMSFRPLMNIVRFLLDVQ